MTDYASDLELIRAAVLTAGDLALAEREAGLKIWSKSGGSPVTSADMAVDKALRDGLLTARPDYGWLSEETADGEERLSRRFGLPITIRQKKDGGELVVRWRTLDQLDRFLNQAGGDES